MPVITVVEDYLLAVLPSALYERQEDGSFYGYLPDFPGVLGFGRDVHETYLDLSRALQTWIHTALAKGYKLPVVNGIDLNTESSQILATYHEGFESPVPREPMFEDEGQFLEALDSSA